MDLKELLQNLYAAQERFDKVRDEELVRELLLVQEEAPLLKDFAIELINNTTTKDINGEDSALIYVFHSSEKTLISPEVFITKSGQIVYEVFDEVNYLKYRPNAIIKNHYNYMEVEEFLRVVPFSSIYNYCLERIEILKEDALEMKKVNDERDLFIKNYKKSFFKKEKNT